MMSSKGNYDQDLLTSNIYFSVSILKIKIEMFSVCQSKKMIYISKKIIKQSYFPKRTGKKKCIRLTFNIVKYFQQKTK